MQTTKIAALNLEQTVARMKSEILADIASGTVPETVSSFSELHDYVDANCYGGFCEDDYIAKAWGVSGFPSDDDFPENLMDTVVDFENDAQNAVHAWLANGRPND